MTARKKLLTKQGYSLFEVASAFQKSVRRGLEDEALYWAVELFESGYDEYCWKRMRIISSEDVGLAEPMMPANIHALYSNYKEQKKKKDEKHRPERLFFTHAILLLVRAKKSRVVDHALLHYWNSYGHDRREIPQFAHDKHTEKGKSAGFGWNHFFEEGTKLENMAEIEGEAEYKAKALESVKLEPPTDKDKFIQGRFFSI